MGGKILWREVSASRAASITVATATATALAVFCYVCSATGAAAAEAANATAITAAPSASATVLAAARATATVAAVDPSASGVAVRRQAATDSDEAAATGNFIRTSWTAVTNDQSDFRVVAQVTSANYGATVWVVLVEAAANDRAIASADISGDLVTTIALPSGAGGAITVTEEELAAAISIAVESVQGTPGATADDPKWKRSGAVSLAARAAGS